MAAAEARRLLGEPERAERLVTPVLVAAEAFGWVEPAATAALAIGRCRLAMDDHAGARPALERAREIAEPSTLPAIAWQAHAELARVCAVEGRTAHAEGHAGAAEAIVRTLAASIPNTHVRRRYENGAAAAIRGSTRTG